MGLERLVHHVVHDGARGVEGAGLFAGGGFGFLVVGGEEVFEDFAEQLGIEGDFLIDGRVFDDGELVAVQDGDEAGNRLRRAPPVTVCGGEVGGFAGIKEKTVWDVWAFLGIA